MNLIIEKMKEIGDELQTIEKRLANRIRRNDSISEVLTKRFNRKPKTDKELREKMNKEDFLGIDQ